MIKKPVLYIDMDGVLCNYHEAHAKQKTESNPYPQSRYGFFRNLKPIENAIPAFIELNNYFDVYILTCPSVHNPLCYTEKREWVETYLGIEACKKLILSPNKALLKGDYLIDDIVHEGFEGEHLHFGTEFKNWNSILMYLIYLQ